MPILANISQLKKKLFIDIYRDHNKIKVHQLSTNLQFYSSTKFFLIIVFLHE